MPPVRLGGELPAAGVAVGAVVDEARHCLRLEGLLARREALHFEASPFRTVLARADAHLVTRVCWSVICHLQAPIQLVCRRLDPASAPTIDI